MTKPPASFLAGGLSASLADMGIIGVKLKSITHPERVTIVRIIARSRLAAYQEGVLAKLASDLG